MGVVYVVCLEMKKLQGKAPLPLPVPSPRSSGLQGRSLFQSGAGSRSMTMGLSPHRGADPGGMNRSASLTRVVDMNRRGSDTGQGGMNRSASLTRGSDAGHGGMNRSASLTREPKLNWMSNSGRFWEKWIYDITHKLKNKRKKVHTNTSSTYEHILILYHTPIYEHIPLYMNICHS